VNANLETIRKVRAMVAEETNALLRAKSLMGTKIHNVSEINGGNEAIHAIAGSKGNDCRCVSESDNGHEGISTSVEMRGDERASVSDRSNGNDRTRVNEENGGNDCRYVSDVVLGNENQGANAIRRGNDADGSERRTDWQRLSRCDRMILRQRRQDVSDCLIGNDIGRVGEDPGGNEFCRCGRLAGTETNEGE